MNIILENISKGLFHVLDSGALDHLFFLVALIVSFSFKYWKKALITISFFTLAHTITLFLATFKTIRINSDFIEILIPVTIILAALFNIFYNKNRKNQYALAFVFGLIHGLGFSGGFKMIFGRVSNKTALLLEFALGIELAQIIVLFAILTVNYIILEKLNINQKKWIQGISIIIVLASFWLFF
jgi:hypothetical protein